MGTTFSFNVLQLDGFIQFSIRSGFEPLVLGLLGDSDGL
jgi:hypothetical protein